MHHLGRNTAAIRKYYPRVRRAPAPPARQMRRGALEATSGAARLQGRNFVPPEDASERRSRIPSTWKVDRTAAHHPMRSDEFASIGTAR
jgi:hypothetical protein